MSQNIISIQIQLLYQKIALQTIKSTALFFVFVDYASSCNYEATEKSNCFIFTVYSRPIVLCH